jgi:Flp pilus assembly protein TadG
VSIEFAIVLPILLMFLLGILAVGIAYNNVMGIANGVREGSRFGATTLSSSTWGATVQAQTVELSHLNFSGNTVVTPSMVCAQLVSAGSPSTVKQASSCNTATAGPVPADPTGLVAGTCYVKVWARMPVEVDLKVVPTMTNQVDRQSIALYERGAC